jgi:hypothetical protein
MLQRGTSRTKELPVNRALEAPSGRDEGRRLRLSTLGGGGAILGALLAVAGNAVVLGAAPHVPATVVSYPLSAHDFQRGQVFFALTQALMALGIVALARTRIAGGGRRARVGAVLAVAGFLLTIPGELVLAVVADAATDSGRATVASSVFGLGVLLADTGLVVLGIEALRARVWPRRWAGLLVVLGLFQLLVVTPVALGAGFASAAAFVVITVQDVLVALLGVRLLRAPQTRPHERMAIAHADGSSANHA